MALKIAVTVDGSVGEKLLRRSCLVNVSQSTPPHPTTAATYECLED